jgi:hypothetical protein
MSARGQWSAVEAANQKSTTADAGKNLLLDRGLHRLAADPLFKLCASYM